MTKDDILDYVAPRHAQHGSAVELAYQHATEDVIQAKAAQLKAEGIRAAISLSRWEKAAAVPLGLFAVAVFGLFFAHLAVVMLALGAAMAAMPLISHKISKREGQQRYLRAVLKQLQPIAGTASCKDALQYLESSAPGTLTWRNIALQERGQLYQFDVEIMRGLYERDRLQIEAAAHTKEEGQQLIDEACRKVHGLTSFA